VLGRVGNCEESVMVLQSRLGSRSKWCHGTYAPGILRLLHSGLISCSVVEDAERLTEKAKKTSAELKRVPTKPSVVRESEAVTKARVDEEGGSGHGPLRKRSRRTKRASRRGKGRRWQMFARPID
jgi:hypothetical protein